MPIQCILNYDDFMDDGKSLVMDLLEHRPKQEICLRVKWPIMTHDRSLKRLTSPTKSNSVFLIRKCKIKCKPLGISYVRNGLTCPNDGPT